MITLLSQNFNNTNVYIASFIPNKEQIKKVTRTLGGQYVIQQIGEPTAVATVTLYANWTPMQEFIDRVNNGERFYLDWEGMRYVCLVISETFKWELINQGQQSHRFYKTTIAVYIENQLEIGVNHVT